MNSSISFLLLLFLSATAAHASEQCGPFVDPAWGLRDESAKILKAQYKGMTSSDEITEDKPDKPFEPIIDKKYALEICFSPYGGLDAHTKITNKIGSVQYDLNSANEELKDYHNTVKCSPQQRQVDYFPQIKTPVYNSDPACIYESLPELDAIEVKGYKAKRIKDAKMKSKFPDHNIELVYEVTDSKGKNRIVGVQTYSAKYQSELNKQRVIEKKKRQEEFINQGLTLKDAQKKIAEEDAHTLDKKFSWGQLVELQKNADGTYTNKTDLPGQAMQGSFLCSFPYFPAGS